jgi:hypothetical protein
VFSEQIGYVHGVSQRSRLIRFPQSGTLKEALRPDYTILAASLRPRT